MNTTKVSIMLVSFVATVLSGAVAEASYQWSATGGPHAIAIASGWMIGGDSHGDGNYSIYKYKSGNWGIVPGGANRDITVDQSGNAWVINSSSVIYWWNGSSFQAFDGSQNWNTVAVGNPHNQFEIWATDVYNRIFWYSGTVDVGGQWFQVTGSALKVAVFNETESCTGHVIHAPWALSNVAGAIYEFGVNPSNSCLNGNYQRVAGAAFDITTEFVTGADFGLYQWDQGRGGFFRVVGPVPDPNNKGTAGIGSGPNGTFAMNSQGNVYVLQSF
jgi:hypothetical protein